MWFCVGASAIPYDLGPIDIGKARRTGQTVSPNEDRQGFPQAEFAPDVGATASGNGAAALADTPSGAVSGNGASTSMSLESQVNNMECGKQTMWFCRSLTVLQLSAMTNYRQHQSGLQLHLWIRHLLPKWSPRLSQHCLRLVYH